MYTSLPKLITEFSSREDFQQLCEKHHIEGLLFFFYRDFNSNADFKSVWLKNWHRNDLYINELKEICVDFNGQFPLISLKGASLLESLYKDLGSRFMSDVDLLVHPDDIQSLETLLKAKDFTLINSTKWKANNFKSEWTKTIDGTEICVELHSKLYYHCANNYTDFVTTKSNIPNLRRLSHIDEFVHLAGHYVHQHTFQKNYWLFDLYLYAKVILVESDEAELLARAKKYKLEKSLFYVFSLFESAFGEKIFSYSAKYKIPTAFLWSDDRSSFEYFKFKHLAKDSIITALEYDIRLLISKF